MMVNKKTVYERGVEEGIYTQEKTIPLLMFHSTEDGWGVIFREHQSLSAFGDTPEEALKEFADMMRVAIDSGLKIDEVASVQVPDTNDSQASSDAGVIDRGRLKLRA